jgi:tripartite-type tricarboxylate transporter receptor subunit TctC
MQPSRRHVLVLAATAAALPVVAHAETYPDRAIRLVVGFPTGGPNDILGRLIAEWLTRRLGQPVTVENRPGGSSNPATEAVVRAPADGHTLLLAGPANAINATLDPNLPFNFLRDITPVAAITREPLVLLVHPSLAATSVAGLIALAKAKPGELKLASTGTGSSPHVSGLLFTMLTGTQMSVVQFTGGGPALKAMTEGEAQVMFEPMSAAIGPVRGGKLRALAVTTAGRSAALPDLPALSETVPGYEASSLTGIGVPAATPPAIVERLNREINAAFADPAMQAHFAETGGTPLPGSSADFRSLMQDETAKWAKVIKAAGVTR